MKVADGNTEQETFKMAVAARGTKVRWTEEMEDVLIDKWQDYECLFNVSSTSYHNRTDKERSWRSVAAALNVSGV